MINIFREILSNDYFKLFVRREGNVVLGRKCTNLWLLTIVLIATFIAIAFSNGSLKYLKHKMDDPFINWVDIKNDVAKGARFSEMRDALKDEALMNRFHYSGFQEDYYFSYMFFGKEDKHVQLLRCRFFESIKSPLVKEILNSKNVIEKACPDNMDEIDDLSIGVIITEEIMKNLGYTKAPAYIDLWRFAEDHGTGFKIINKGTRVPLPVIGVVDRLPGNVDLISSRYCYEQENNDYTYPFLMDNYNYASSLNYFVPASVNRAKFIERLQCLLSENGCERNVCEDSFFKPEIIPFKKGGFVNVESYDMIPVEVATAVNDAIMNEYSNQDVHRVFDYEFSEYHISESAYISVNFKNLNAITEFQDYVHDHFNVNIEMAQINAKENFNAVRLMANILSWAMITFAIVCIILFIVNLLQSYFQKVKRNLGTFKAFGMSNRRLISIYALIMLAIVIVAVVTSLTITWLVQIMLPLLGIMKEGTFNYLSLWNAKTAVAVIIIVGASLCTVYAVMGKLLRQTPGDLIYDR